MDGWCSRVKDCLKIATAINNSNYLPVSGITVNGDASFKFWSKNCWEHFTQIFQRVGNLGMLPVAVDSIQMTVAVKNVGN